MNKILLLIYFIFLPILLTPIQSVEISCWSILYSNSYRRRVVLDNVGRSNDPRCVIITPEIDFIKIPFVNQKVLCPSYVKDTYKNRKLLGLAWDNPIVNSDHDSHLTWTMLNNDYCRTVSVTEEFDLDISILCQEKTRFKRSLESSCNLKRKNELDESNPETKKVKKENSSDSDSDSGSDLDALNGLSLNENGESDIDKDDEIDAIDSLFRREYPRNLRDLLIFVCEDLNSKGELDKKSGAKRSNKNDLNNRSCGLNVNSILKEHLKSKNYSDEEINEALIDKQIGHVVSKVILKKSAVKDHIRNDIPSLLSLTGINENDKFYIDSREYLKNNYNHDEFETSNGDNSGLSKNYYVFSTWAQRRQFKVSSNANGKKEIVDRPKDLKVKGGLAYNYMNAKELGAKMMAEKNKHLGFQEMTLTNGYKSWTLLQSFIRIGVKDKPNYKVGFRFPNDCNTPEKKYNYLEAQRDHWFKEMVNEYDEQQANKVVQWANENLKE